MRRHRRMPLGDLELAVLDRLWAGGPAEVSAMHAAVGSARGISPNTVHSALERLVRKQLAERSRSGRAYEYRAAVSRRDWLARCFDGVASELPGASAETLFVAFVDLAERVGPDALAELERLVRERRLGRGGRP